MRCGICGKTTMRGYQGEQVPISSIYFLNQHKRVEHRAEYWDARVARRAKALARETTKRTKAAEAQRVSDARLQASRPVVEELLAALKFINGDLNEMITAEHADHTAASNCLLCSALFVSHAAITKATSPQAREEGRD